MQNRSSATGFEKYSDASKPYLYVFRRVQSISSCCKPPMALKFCSKPVFAKTPCSISLGRPGHRIARLPIRSVCPRNRWAERDPRHSGTKGVVWTSPFRGGRRERGPPPCAILPQGSPPRRCSALKRCVRSNVMGAQKGVAAEAHTAGILIPAHVSGRFGRLAPCRAAKSYGLKAELGFRLFNATWGRLP
jgi:hypothetical protein